MVQINLVTFGIAQRTLLTLVDDQIKILIRDKGHVHENPCIALLSLAFSLLIASDNSSTLERGEPHAIFIQRIRLFLHSCSAARKCYRTQSRWLLGMLKQSKLYYGMCYYEWPLSRLTGLGLSEKYAT